MKKWPFYAIIFFALAFGLKLCSDEIEKRFYSVEITAPKNELTEKKQTTAPSEKKPSTPTNAEGDSVITAPPSVQKTENSDTMKAKTAPVSSGISLETINKMSAAELESLNGVGPVLAKRIFDYKTSNGPFKTVNELLKVKGIGEKKLAKIKEQMQ